MLTELLSFSKFQCKKKYVKRKIVEILFIIILVGLVIGLVFVYKNQHKETPQIKEYSVFCDFETLNEENACITSKDEYVISNVKLTDKIAFEGEKSLIISESKVYQNLILLDNLTSNSNVTIRLKRNSSSNAAIVVEGKDKSKLYYINSTPSFSEKNGWDNLELRFNCANDFKDAVKVYIYNPNKQKTYIDNLEVIITKGDFFPEYNNVEPLLIYVEDAEFNKLKKKRDEAFEKGVLITEEDSWVNAIIYGSGKMMHATIRLKGDWLDHLQGEKWSFRIKLKDDSWNGMRVFSIQSPISRGFLNEWILHKSCKDQDILTTKYSFVPVYLNGKSLGIYSYEEHFQKELIESSKRREGPIIKFSESDFWYFMLKGKPNGFTLNTSVIEPFSASKTMNDSVKYQQFLIAANLLDMYRTLGAKASEIFDVKKMAKFIAMVNSRNAFHTLEWHNIRYYYNPVLCRLEPIAFDMFAGVNEFTKENPLSPMLGKGQYYNINYSIFYLMTDSVFEKSYLEYIQLFCNEYDYQYYKNKYSQEYEYFDSLNRLEFYPYYYDQDQFRKILDSINVYLPAFKDSLKREGYRTRIKQIKDKPFFFYGLTKSLLYGDRYVKFYKQDNYNLFVKCFLQYDIDIIGLGDKEGIITTVNKTVLNKGSGIIKDSILTFSNNLNDFDYVFFKIRTEDTIFKTEIVQWPAPTTYNPRTDIATTSTDLSEYIDHENKEVHFSGSLRFDKHVYTPYDYTVIIDPGTTIDITNQSAFIVNANVIINGTLENPVMIHSSDKTANGFTILQSDKQSVVNYAHFDNLTTLNYNGWTLTGAVTFYEADVEFNNCQFTNNHCEDMLNTVRCHFSLKNCTIENTFGDSHDSDFCTGTLDNCTFNNNGNDAIDFSTSESTITNCIINGAGDKGISVGENTQATIIDVTISDVNIGIASKDLSHAEVNGCVINRATYGFLILQKKPEFGSASITAYNCELNDVWTKSLIERNSTLVLNGKKIEGKKAKLKSLFYE